MRLNQKSVLASVLIFCLTAGLWGCVSWKGAEKSEDEGLDIFSLVPFPRPKAKIALADFEVSQAKISDETGAGLRAMLISALTETKRFRILAKADLLITVSVVEFKPEASGGRDGLGGGGDAGSGALGGLLGTSVNKSHLTLGITMVDTATSKVLASKSVQGQASDLLAKEAANLGLTGALSSYAHTPMSKAICISINEAVRFIQQAIPADYYKY